MEWDKLTADCKYFLIKAGGSDEKWIVYDTFKRFKVRGNLILKNAAGEFRHSCESNRSCRHCKTFSALMLAIIQPAGPLNFVVLFKLLRQV